MRIKGKCRDEDLVFSTIGLKVGGFSSRAIEDPIEYLSEDVKRSSRAPAAGTKSEPEAQLRIATRHFFFCSSKVASSR